MSARLITSAYFAVSMLLLGFAPMAHAQGSASPELKQSDTSIPVHRVLSVAGGIDFGLSEHYNAYTLLLEYHQSTRVIAIGGRFLYATQPLGEEWHRTTILECAGLIGVTHSVGVVSGSINIGLSVVERILSGGRFVNTGGIFYGGYDNSPTERTTGVGFPTEAIIRFQLSKRAAVGAEYYADLNTLQSLHGVAVVLSIVLGDEPIR